MQSRFAKFKKDGTIHFMHLKQTGDMLPRPARIVISKEYWDDTGGVRGWETTKIYDRSFDDWKYAYAVFDEVLNRADKILFNK